MVIFAHGYKGYKDWGCWDLVGKAMTAQGFAFLKFNFSHNGGTVEEPIDFPDLEAFGGNNYIIELEDLNLVIDRVRSMPHFKKSKIALIGHSRGGFISTLSALEKQVDALITWAAVADVRARIPEDRLDEWRSGGVIHEKNGRTGQDMPVYYQFYESLIENTDRLKIARASAFGGAVLVVHGTGDEAVSHQEAMTLCMYMEQAELILLDGAGHTFGSKQPWDNSKMPDQLKQVVDETIKFLRSVFQN